MSMDWIRGRPRAAAAAGIVGVLAVLVIVYLMASSSGGSPGPRSIDDLSGLPSVTPTSEPTLDLPTATPTKSTPTPTTSISGGTAGGGGLSGLPVGGGAIKSGDIDLPGLPGGTVYQYAPKHRVVLRVTSQGPIGTIGYYIPYSPDKQSGTVKRVGTSWSLKTFSYGDPDYARIYVSSGADPSITVTCTITVDGKVTTKKTTDGPYSVLICQG